MKYERNPFCLLDAETRRKPVEKSLPTCFGEQQAVSRPCSPWWGCRNQVVFRLRASFAQFINHTHSWQSYMANFECLLTDGAAVVCLHFL